MSCGRALCTVGGMVVRAAKGRLRGIDSRPVLLGLESGSVDSGAVRGSSHCPIGPESSHCRRLRHEKPLRNRARDALLARRDALLARVVGRKPRPRGFYEGIFEWSVRRDRSGHTTFWSGAGPVAGLRPVTPERPVRRLRRVVRHQSSHSSHRIAATRGSNRRCLRFGSTHK